MTSDDPTVETALGRRMRLIKQLTLLTFRNGNDDEEGARICAVSNQNISNSSFDQVQMVASSLTHLVLTDMPR